MAHITPCDKCKQSGFPILFTRYAAGYSGSDEGTAVLDKFKPTGNFKSQPGGVAQQQAKISVHMLRAGCLYIYMGTKCRSPQWYGYAIHPHGYCTEFDIEDPKSASAEAACRPNEWGDNRSLVWVKDAEDVTDFHYLFSPSPLDPDHLKGQIQGNLGKYTQSFDVAGWHKGNTSQDHSCQAAQLDSEVVEFAARTDEKLRDACEPLLYGLMGSNAIERDWGPKMVKKETTTEREDYKSEGWGATEKIKETEVSWSEDPGLPYNQVHGKRLQGMQKYLTDQKGAVLACDDPMGIAQELGHLQAEAQALYTKWQLKQAAGYYKDVSNEWAYQSAMGGTSLIDLVRESEAKEINDRFGNTNYPRAPLPRDPLAAEQEQARRTAARERSHQAQLKRADKTINDAVQMYFYEARAKAIIETQGQKFDETERLKAKLGADQNAWLQSGAMEAAVGRYSDKAALIDQHGGGAALSVHLAQCMAGTESNSNGVAWVHKSDLTSMGVLGRTICFNSITLQDTWKEVGKAKLEETPSPKAEPNTRTTESISEIGKVQAARFGLGDKVMGLEDAFKAAKVGERTAALILKYAGSVGQADKAMAFIDRMKTFSDSGLLAKALWPVHIATLLSVKMMKTVHSLPVPELEAQVVRFTALTGLITLGKQARAEVTRLNLPLNEADAWQKAQQKIANAGHAANGRAGAPDARAAGIGALFDLGQALLKARQLSVKGVDPRLGWEMVGGTFQAIGSLADWRAKTLEETIYKGVRALDLSTTPGMETGAIKSLNVMRLKSLRLTAFKFLLPAAMISAVCDATDGLQSLDRGQIGLAKAQFAGAVGTAFAITATGLAAFGAGSTMTIAFLGFVGAALALGSAAYVMWFKEGEWINWLIDSPLNKQRANDGKPLHESLRETLQKLANVRAEVAAN
jgi:hypothetical protein